MELCSIGTKLYCLQRSYGRPELRSQRLLLSGIQIMTFQKGFKSASQLANTLSYGALHYCFQRVASINNLDCWSYVFQRKPVFHSVLDVLYKIRFVLPVFYLVFVINKFIEDNCKHNKLIKLYFTLFLFSTVNLY